MKKIILTVATIFALGAVNAQDLKSKKGENYLPEAGDWAISFNADGIFNYVGNAFNGNLGNGAPELDYVKDFDGTFVGKMFKTDKNAYRVVANLGFGSDTQELVAGEAIPNYAVNIYGAGVATDKVKTTSSGFNLAAGLGKEWRRGKTRLQGFYGADVILSLSSNTVKYEANDSATGTFIDSVEQKSGLGIGLGVNGFLGAEYFLFPKFSLGAQYNYGLGVTIKGKSESTVQVGNAPAVSADGGKGSNFGLGDVGVASINLTLHF